MDLRSFSGQKTSEGKDRDSHAEGPYTTTVSICNNNSLSLSPEGCTEFIPVIINLGKRKTYTF